MVLSGCCTTGSCGSRLSMTQGSRGWNINRESQRLWSRGVHAGKVEGLLGSWGGLLAGEGAPGMVGVRHSGRGSLSAS